MSESILPGSQLSITIRSAPASDGWGFVGQVMIGEHECYRTLRAHTGPLEALHEVKVLVGDALGALLAGQEWRNLGEQVGRVPTRQDLRLGLSRSDEHRARSDGA